MSQFSVFDGMHGQAVHNGQTVFAGVGLCLGPVFGRSREAIARHGCT